MKNKITKSFLILCLRYYSFIGVGLYIAEKYILPPAIGRYEYICGLFPNRIICEFIFLFEESFILWLLHIPLFLLYSSIDDYISLKISEKRSKRHSIEMLALREKIKENEEEIAEKIKKIKERRKQELNKKEEN